MNNDDRADIAQLRLEVAGLAATVARTNDNLARVETSVKNLVAAWETAGGVVRFVKGLSQIIAAFAVIVAAVMAARARWGDG